MTDADFTNRIANEAIKILQKVEKEIKGAVSDKSGAPDDDVREWWDAKIEKAHAQAKKLDDMIAGQTQDANTLVEEAATLKAEQEKLDEDLEGVKLKLEREEEAIQHAKDVEEKLNEFRLTYLGLVHLKEATRTYYFAKRNIVITEPRTLAVADKGVHVITNALGDTIYVAKGWYAIGVENE
jgi:hypothetical protein